MDKKNKWLLFLFIVVIVYALDRYTKYLSGMFRGCFGVCIKRSVNYGASFNLLQGFSFTLALLIIVGIIVMFLSAFFYSKTKNKVSLEHWGLALLFSGTLANLVDRAFYGYVIDFLTMPFAFPSFNLADLSNLAGVTLLIIFLVKKK